MQELRGLNPRCPIVVTRGGDGATLYHSAGQVSLPSAPVQVVDTVGAGDALCAGLLVSATEHPEALWTEHLKFGLRAAAVTCAHAGGYAPTREEVEGV